MVYNFAKLHYSVLTTELILLYLNTIICLASNRKQENAPRMRSEHLPR